MLSANVAQAVSPDPAWSMRLGFDLVQISQVADSLDQFGALYEERLFTAGELEYARRGEHVHAERLAARFAAKEAVIKALQLSDAGLVFRDIEVCKMDDGSCEVQLHGRAAELAQDLGHARILLSLSHDGDYAAAVATVLVRHDAAQGAAA